MDAMALAIGLPRPERRGPGLLKYFDVPQTRFQANFPSWLLSLLALAWISCGTETFEAGPVGAVEVAPGDDIQIRSMAVLSGIGDLGVPSQRGVMLALADYGPIQGRNVSMGAGLDSLCTAEAGRAAANTVTGDPRVVGVIGASCSVAAAAASPILSEAGLVMVAPSTTSPFAHFRPQRHSEGPTTIPATTGLPTTISTRHGR